MSNFEIVQSLGAELFCGGGWADGRIDVTKLVAAFHNFVNAPKNQSFLLCITHAGHFPTIRVSGLLVVE
jgi:hypothetical protein